MEFRKRIRLSPEAYADRSATFHLVIHTHPKVSRLSSAVLDAVWTTVVEQRDADRVQLFAACLMPDHLHLIAKSANLNLLRFIDAWKAWSTRRAWAAGHIGLLWQPSFWDRTIRNFEDFVETRAYVLSNPVAAGLVAEFDDWPWSWAKDLDA